MRRYRIYERAEGQFVVQRKKLLGWSTLGGVVGWGGWAVHVYPNEPAARAALASIVKRDAFRPRVVLEGHS